MTRSASIFGVYGLSLLTVLGAALPACLGDRSPMSRRLLPLLIAFAAWTTFLAWGAERLAPGSDPEVPDLTLRLVQTGFGPLIHVAGYLGWWAVAVAAVAAAVVYPLTGPAR